jgi:hypothetical protein
VGASVIMGSKSTGALFIACLFPLPRQNLRCK